jgi:hypothetical protein
MNRTAVGATQLRRAGTTEGSARWASDGAVGSAAGTRREFDRNSTGIRRECDRNPTGMRPESDGNAPIKAPFFPATSMNET